MLVLVLVIVLVIARLVGRFDCEYRIVHASGEVRWVWERGSGIFDAQDRLIAIEGLIQDVTARKRAEDALRLSDRAIILDRGRIVLEDDAAVLLKDFDRVQKWIAV